MITQQHENEIQQKAQAPSPVKEHPWRVALFSILGVALPLVAGVIQSLPLVSADIVTTDLILALVVVLVVVPVAVGAFLLCFAFRAWWVAVFAGVAWIVGEFLTAVVRLLVEGGGPTLHAQEFFWFSQGGIILLLSVPLIIGMAIGAAGGLALGKRRALRK